ncbi:hypothetical protein LZ30DRAFT_690965 [Colletotrichum cereale]|nr:hypothetical protein LZ30DRAFT_690965 [Colletotrichum cereale]
MNFESDCMLTKDAVDVGDKPVEEVVEVVVVELEVLGLKAGEGVKVAGVAVADGSANGVGDMVEDVDETLGNEDVSVKKIKLLLAPEESKLAPSDVDGESDAATLDNDAVVVVIVVVIAVEVVMDVDVDVVMVVGVVMAVVVVAIVVVATLQRPSLGVGTEAMMGAGGSWRLEFPPPPSEHQHVCSASFPMAENSALRYHVAVHTGLVVNENVGKVGDAATSAE